MLRDPWNMARAGLPDAQSPDDASRHPPGSVNGPSDLAVHDDPVAEAQIARSLAPAQLGLVPRNLVWADVDVVVDWWLVMPDFLIL